MLPLPGYHSMGVVAVGRMVLCLPPSPAVPLEVMWTAGAHQSGSFYPMAVGKLNQSFLS
jgi:hypothetical protein